MADNVAITAGTGTTIAADDIGAGVLAQRVKPVWGPDGTGNDVDIATGKPLPAQIRSATGLIPIGEPTDAKNTATDTTSVSLISVNKQISASAQTVATNSASRSQLLNTGSSNGSIIAPLALTSGADLASLASGGAVTLAGGGAAGVSSQANTGSAKRGIIYFQTVTAGFTPTAGGNISIWFLNSPDGGTAYESTPATASTTVPALPRPPDCIIPLDAAALGTSALKYSQPCKLPEGTFKVLVQNNSGAAFGAGNYTMKLVAFAENN